jgi:hypothetical protein
MEVPLRFVYLISTIPAIIVWTTFYIYRKDLRKEMLVMSVPLALVSFLTSYYWWSIDWWSPPTIFGTKAGIEDLILGFTVGGVLAIIYEVVFKRKYSERKFQKHSALIILLFITQTISWLFWGLGISSFWSSLIAMICASIVLIFLRKDLFLNAIFTGFVAAFLSLPFYYLIMILNSHWVDYTYSLQLSGVRLTGVPIEELIFWLAAGFLIGPMYEYWQGRSLTKMN